MRLHDSPGLTLLKYFPSTGRIVQFSVGSSGDEGVDAPVAPCRSASGMGRGVFVVSDTEGYAVDPFVASKFDSILGDVHCGSLILFARIEKKVRLFCRILFGLG